MSNDRHKYNDFFRKKLDNFESSVSDNIFDQLMSDRIIRDQLDKFESITSENLFDKLMRDREGSDEIASDGIMRQRLLEHETPIPPQTFNHIIAEREHRRRLLIKRSAAVSALLLLSYFMFIRHETIVNTEKDKGINKNKKDNFYKKDDNYKTNSPFTTNSIAISKMAYPTSIASNSTNYSTEHAASQQTIIPTTLSISTISPEAAVSVNMTVLDKPKQPTSQSKNIESEPKEQTNTTTQYASTALNPRLEPHYTLENAPITSYTEGGVLAATSPVLAFENLDILKIKNIPLPVRNLKNPCTSGDPGDGCPSFSKRNRRHGDGGEKAVYVDIYGAPEYAFRRLSQNLPESAPYLAARDSVEKSWYAFSAGARVSVVFGNGLALRTGLIYSQNNEIATFDSLGVGEKKRIETYLPRSGGGQDTIYRTEITSGIFRMKHYNRYRSVDLPLQLGFEFPMSDYWAFSVNGGVNFNISSWRKATILNEKLTREDASSTIGELNPIFRNTFGMSVFGSIAAYRQLSGNLQLVVEPSIRHNLQPITRSDYALKQGYTNMGLIVGLRFSL